MKKSFFLIFVFFLFGCKSEYPKPARGSLPVESPQCCKPPADTYRPVSEIIVTDLRNFLPFERTYEVPLSKKRKMIITAKKSKFTYLYKSTNNIEWEGELIQENGKKVVFDPFEVADKIIDPVLVPEIEKAMPSIFSMDKDFRNSTPHTITDLMGHIYRLEEADGQ